jgi:putative hydrolase of the HAD superfamily
VSTAPQARPGIKHVLLDADGVLQHVPTDWRERLAALDVTDDVFAEVLAAEGPPLRGEGDFLVSLAEIVQRHGLGVTAEQLHGTVWSVIEPLPTSIELVHRLRASGYAVHLGTNQHAQRAAHMRRTMAYDDLFDVSVYSCDIGVAKPDPAYFGRALELIVAEPHEVLFVDDREDNVLGARAAGLVAEQWIHGDGLDVLVSRLAAHGVVLS